MNPLFSPLKDYPAFQQTLESIQKKQTAALYDMTESQRAFFACALSDALQRPVLYVLPTMQTALRAGDDCAAFYNGKAAALPAADMQFIQGTVSRDSQWQRMMTLRHTQEKRVQVLCAPAEALLQRFPSPQMAAKRILVLRQADQLDPQALIAKLTAWGYERVDMVEGRGQCALRGDIVDVYPPQSDMGYRIEFFDRDVDSIRPFDPVTQRSEGRLNECTLTAAAEYLLAKEEREQAAQRMEAIIRGAMQKRSALQSQRTLDDPEQEEGLQVGLMTGYHRMLRDAERLRDSGTFSTFHLWQPLLTSDSVPLEAWLDNPLLVLDTPDRVLTRAQDRLSGFYEDVQQALTREEAVPEQAQLLYDMEEVKTRLQGLDVVTMQDLLRGMAGIEPQALIQMKGLSATKYRGRFRQLSDDIKAFTQQGYAVGLLAGGTARSERIRQMLYDFDCPLPSQDGEENQLARGKAALLPLSISHGFILEDAKLMLVSDSDLYGKSQKKTKQTANVGARIEAFVELSAGDYVVHEHHGIGVYQGTVRLQSEGTWRDYLLIQYKGTDKLYVPTDQFDRVQKYIGGQGDAPQLNDLSGNTWAKQKSKVKLSLQKLAFDLLRLYAQRQSTPGFAFPTASPWEQQFDENFEFELTDDQQSAVNDVLRDMEKPVNMDRLLCGDVGYGKTEVAMRAAFRAVMGGKQVAMLAPTTILVQQHYRTFQKRFQGFPVGIGMISRFRSPRENKETLRKMQAGEIDILIGTHRLLSKDVRFKDLGLLIVDEEQRFGVGHKEIIKNMKRTVDVLTLSATPIPRTLHMSMVGVRDMSLLETPPEERYPVQSYVVDYNDGVVRDAILRELGRDGQVFFLFNRVQQIDAFASRLRNLVPEARIAIAHGQMRDNALEDVMMDFSEGKFNVLLCTTIIENGIDIPRANTLIVFDADRFGLSQLYQLRGRVGRSNRAAYAYFLVKGDKALTETAEKRLAAIKEFTEFGAGFRIAMRDLEIRGAGNIFGPEQSGQVSVIGYDMYCKMIEEAVREAQGDFAMSRQSERETRVELHVNAFLPESYVSGQSQRVEIYKRISLIRSQEDRMQLVDDLLDRFGEPPQEVMTLMDIALLRSLAGLAGSDMVTFGAGFLTLRLKEEYIEDLHILVEALKDSPLTLVGGKKPALVLSLPQADDEAALRQGITAMKQLTARMDKLAEEKKKKTTVILNNH